jgi:hypothetical protein
MRNTQECGYASPVWHWWVPEQLLTSRGRVGEHVLNMRLEPANARWALLDGHQSAASEAAPQMNPFRRPGRMPCVTCTPHPSQQQCECGGNLKWKPPPPKLTPLMQLYKTRTRHLTRTAFMLVDLPHDLVAHLYAAAKCWDTNRKQCRKISLGMYTLPQPSPRSATPWGRCILPMKYGFLGRALPSPRSLPPQKYPQNNDPNDVCVSLHSSLFHV